MLFFQHCTEGHTLRFPIPRHTSLCERFPADLSFPANINAHAPKFSPGADFRKSNVKLGVSFFQRHVVFSYVWVGRHLHYCCIDPAKLRLLLLLVNMIFWDFTPKYHPVRTMRRERL